MVAMKRKVLLIDLDPQGNATMGSGIDKNAVQYSAYDLLTNNASAEQCILHSESAGFDVIASNSDVTAAEVELLDEQHKESRLRSALKAVSPKYHYIFIDCPPTLNMLTINALCASQGVIIPMQCEYFALEGLADLLQTVDSVKQTINPSLDIEYLRTMYDPRNSLTKDVSAQLSDYFGDKLYNTVIPRNVRLAEAPSFGMPILAYDKSSKGALAYLALAGEMSRQHKAKAKALKAALAAKEQA